MAMASFSILLCAESRSLKDETMKKRKKISLHSEPQTNEAYILASLGVTGILAIALPKSVIQ
jgi:hypothetical protein